MPRRKKPIEPDAPEVEVIPTPVPEPIVMEPSVNLLAPEPTFAGSLGPKHKGVVLVDVNCGQAVYIDGVKVSGKERRSHMADLCDKLKRTDIISLRHWRCAGVQLFECQVRETGFPAKLSDLPQPPEESIYPKP